MIYFFFLILISAINLTEEILVTGFDPKNDPEWNVVNDRVMGGLSTSWIQYLPENLAVFSGEVSLENNGGFASSRMKLKSGKLAGCTVISLRLKGDGKKYKLKVKTDNQMDGVTYSADFLTKNDEWMEIELQFKHFIPTYRGRILNQVGPLIAADILQVGLLISDKQSGPFSLTLDWIKCK